jgi:hypothetical protein
MVRRARLKIVKRIGGRRRGGKGLGEVGRDEGGWGRA